MDDILLNLLSTADIGNCLEKIVEGESYELCLTNKVLTSYRPDALALHLKLRKQNPAPYGAFLRFGDVELCSCSPEKFITIDNNRFVTTKPIKGTMPRGLYCSYIRNSVISSVSGRNEQEDTQYREMLATDPKSYSENLMIVDLMRNDIGKTCCVNSVIVPRLMGAWFLLSSFSFIHPFL
jgi:para-aminobenzoate synthetase